MSWYHNTILSFKQLVRNPNKSKYKTTKGSDKTKWMQPLGFLIEWTGSRKLY